MDKWRRLLANAQKHAGQLDQRQGAAIPPGFEADICKVRELGALCQRDPRAFMLLIEVYEQIIARLQPEEAPAFYATTQSNLGIAYRNLPVGKRASNLAKAIECYKEALRFWTPEVAPYEYARTMSNLGNVLGDLPTGDRAANMTRAIECYWEALRFWTPDVAPLEYAAVQNNLGVTYVDLPTGDREANLAQAIQCYKEALRFRTPGTDRLKYAETQNNLGVALCNLPVSDRAINLPQAIQCYREALRFWTPEVAPFLYARIEHNLGNAYRDLPTGNRATNLTQSILCYKEALRFLTPETDPLAYAAIQNNLATACKELPNGNRTSNLARAVHCYEEALRFLTPEAEPFAYRGTAHNLADLHFAQGAWDEALRAYRKAMHAGEQLYRAGLSTESKSAEVFKNSTLYPNAAFAAVRCGETTEALLILEQGKTRLLTEALRLRVPRPPRVPDEIWDTFQQAGAAVRAAQAGQAPVSMEMTDPLQAYEAHIQAVRATYRELDTAIEHVRVHAPRFLEAIDRATIAAQLSDTHTALLALCITEQGSKAFIMSQRDQLAVSVVEVPAFTQTDLRQLLIEQNAGGQPVGGWLVAYNRHLDEQTAASFNAWQETITRVLAESGERLIAPLLPAIPAEIERIVLLPSAELFLLPLHAVPLPGSDANLLCDRYKVSYAPSIEVLAGARARATQEVKPELYALINPGKGPRLPFTPVEGEAIARLFAQSTVDVEQAGVKERVLAGMRGRSYVHFSCHGNYNWDDPPASGLSLVDGRLTLADLQQGEVDLSAARLVTLSACETGITDILQGSPAEYVGIPAGFLLAGAPCVVSSLWSVSDLSTALLMERFYRQHLVEKMDIAAALQEAQLWLRELSIRDVAAYAERCYRQSTLRGKDELFMQASAYQSLAEQNPTLRPFANPHYWAAFTVNGW
ncbi:MAG TPA: CHAT domain-containing tetratricopeptide repeat protein [Ktedonobacteraceae bacterium]|nr:CHAT domain-containing tetratricopeptide repeat protein [Ktedonobacteraceae bacterium]